MPVAIEVTRALSDDWTHVFEANVLPAAVPDHPRLSALFNFGQLPLPDRHETILVLVVLRQPVFLELPVIVFM
jgi:hypothetical protein